MSDACAVTKQCRKSLFYFTETHHVCLVHLDQRIQMLRDLLETAKKHCCQQCKTADAVVCCLDCVPSGTQFLCPACDLKVHKKHVLHDREVTIYVFFKPIPPTSSVVINQSGQYQLAEQVMLKDFSR